MKIGPNLAMRFIAPLGGAAVEFVAAAKATSPVSETTDGGTNITVPVPGATEEGDLMLVVEGCSSGASHALPAGWTTVEQGVNPPAGADTRRVSKKVASASEPASYTFATDPGVSRTACIIVLRGGTTITDSSTVHGGDGSVPSATATKAGSMFVALIAISHGGATTERLGADSPLTLQVQHTSTGGAYQTPFASGIATESVGPGTVSGRAFTHDSFALGQKFAVIVEPD